VAGGKLQNNTELIVKVSSAIAEETFFYYHKE